MEKSKLTAEDKAALTIEIEAMKRLSDHDSFVKLYEFFDEETKYMLVIELISGGELFDRIVEKEKYTEREARRVIRQLTEAMAYAHSKGIAHRDLKPENVLLRDKADDTSIKIADFGFAKIITESEPLMKTPCG
jgi:calcium/calmodulin-dependent protein kinase I